jgi:hypothetical protein
MVCEPLENQLSLIAGSLIGVKASCITMPLQWYDIIKQRHFLAYIFNIHIDFKFFPNQVSLCN